MFSYDSPMNRLNIPLSSSNGPTKRLLARIGGVFALILVAWLLTRAYWVLDTTTWLRPASSTSSVYVPMYPGAIRQLTDNLGPNTLIVGKPWAIDQLPSWCHRACSIHLNETGSIHAITIDRALNAAETAKITATGLSIEEINGKTLIWTSSEPLAMQEVNGRFPFRLLFPWNDAILYDHQKNQRASIRIHDRGITILTPFSLKDPHPVIFSEDAEILAQMSFVPDKLPYPLNNLVLDLPIQSLLNGLHDTTVSLSLAQHDEQLLFSLQLPVSLDQQEVAALSRELIKPSNLSTLEWTLSDGTALDEIRFDDTAIFVETSSDGTTSYIEVRNKAGETVLRLTQTSETLLISNAQISLTQGKNDKSSCLRNARAFIRPIDLITTIETSTTASAKQTYPLFTDFYDIGFSSSRVMMCW